MPLLTLLFGADIRYAIGASLISVIATSSGAAAAYVREGFTNIRIGMFLEIATTVGALGGAYIAPRIAGNALAIIFGIVLLYSAFVSSRPRRKPTDDGPPDRLSVRLRLDSDFPGDTGQRYYKVRHIPGGFFIMLMGGALSGLLGIGAGAFKVIAMDQVMRIPFKVSTTTSNFMIGVTAAAGAGVYLNRGYIDPGLAMPVMLGALGGSLLGTRFLVASQTRVLRIIFGLIIAGLAVEMIYNGIIGGF